MVSKVWSHGRLNEAENGVGEFDCIQNVLMKLLLPVAVTWSDSFHCLLVAPAFPSFPSSPPFRHVHNPGDGDGRR